MTDAVVKTSYLDFVRTKPGFSDVFAAMITIAAKGSREAVGLQAADAIAYESSRLLRTWLVGPHRRPRGLLARLKKKGRYNGIFFDDDRKIWDIGRHKLSERIADRLTASTGTRYMPATRVVSSDSLLGDAAQPEAGRPPRPSGRR